MAVFLYLVQEDQGIVIVSERSVGYGLYCIIEVFGCMDVLEEAGTLFVFYHIDLDEVLVMPLTQFTYDE